MKNIENRLYKMFKYTTVIQTIDSTCKDEPLQIYIVDRLRFNKTCPYIFQ